MGASDEDRARLAAHGWNVVEPLPMSLDILGAYPDYIRGSRAEFTVAKDMNVRLRSGWFSERDACYLASGKPVVAQDTGFSNVLPTGAGLFSFTDLDSARAAVEEINADYRPHARAAREVAQEHFEASGVARRLLADLGLAP
jgi:glycosyltransferase involved in cell wall biosynthesis